MKYLFGIMCVLVLGVMACSETSCPECGGDGEPVADCTLVDEEVECILDGGGVGVCIDDSCVPTDCSELEDGAPCASYSIGVGVCDTVDGEAECAVAVSDCSGIANATPCFENFDEDAIGNCYDELCIYADCGAVGDPCFWNPAGEGPDVPGLCSAEEVCTFECEVLEEGAECRIEFGGATGVCEGGECVFE